MGDDQKVCITVVEFIETTIFSAMVISTGSMTATVITYWTAPFFIYRIDFVNQRPILLIWVLTVCQFTPSWRAIAFFDFPLRNSSAIISLNLSSL